MKETLYFAYGSNLDPVRMRRRCPASEAGGPATLDGWRLAFGGHSRTWDGPVATLIKAPGERVAGLLYAVPPEDLAALDCCEGHPTWYRRRRLLITDDSGRRRHAQVYVLPVAEVAPPAPAYLAVLWQAYRLLGFDPEPLVAAAGGMP